MTPSFDDLNLSPALRNALNDLGLESPTPIQEKSFSVVMSGRDVMGLAQTGTGKTFAYLLPILRQLDYSKQSDPRVLILVPTRELVVQLVGEIKKLTGYMTVRVEGVYGGANIQTQKALVAAGLDILVATPGRLIDLAMTRVLKLGSIRRLVIDEVDEMLGLGFLPQLTKIFDLLPPRRQNLLFSATMTEEVDAMLQEFFSHPQFVEVTRPGTPLEKISQGCYHVPNFYTKINLLKRLLGENPEMEKVLIFCPSKKIADLVLDRLEEDFPDQFDAVHSNKSQNFRLNAVAAFQKGSIRGLVTTDLLARGMDVSDVTHVISLNTPDTAETYIHRIGRTGRAESEGAALALVAPYEMEYKRAIETLMGKEIPLLPLPEDLELSLDLLPDEQHRHPAKNYLKAPTLKHSQGAFHEKKDKNKKVNKGNKSKWLKDMKYKKSSKKAKKR